MTKKTSGIDCPAKTIREEELRREKQALLLEDTNNERSRQRVEEM